MKKTSETRQMITHFFHYTLLSCGGPWWPQDKKGLLRRISWASF